MSFEKSVKELIENRVRNTELNILVWGPGKGGGEHFKKRKKVQQQLQEQFVKADVRFSEELGANDIPPGSKYIEPHEQELWHLAACDVCIVLDTSKGAGEEIAHFVSTSQAFKLLILTAEQYRRSSSFPASLRRNQNQMFYT